MHPSWEVAVWREADIDALGLTNRAAYDYYMATPTKRRQGGMEYNGAANVARVEILLRSGGVYVDIDSVPLRPLDPLLRHSFFAGFEPGVPTRPGRIANGTIGSARDHPILRRYVALIGGLGTLLPAWDTSGGTALTQAVARYRYGPGVHIYEPRVFYPEDHRGRPAPGRQPSYTRHLFASTHSSYPVSG